MRKHTVRLLLEGRHGLSSLPRQTTVQRSKRVNTTVLRGVRTQILHPSICEQSPINTIYSKYS